MIDIDFIRKNPDLFDQIMSSRKCDIKSNHVLKLDAKKRSLVSDVNNLRRDKKNISEEIRILKSKSMDCNQKIKDSIDLDSLLRSKELELAEDDFLSFMSTIPNVLDSRVPIGNSETDNVVLKTVGKKKELSFNPKSHEDLGLKLGMMDFDTASTISGSRFVVFYDKLALMERALSHFMLDVAIQKFDYKELSVPLIVREKSMYNACQLPKFKDDAFQTSCGYWMIPTGEVPLVNIVSGKVLNDLPLRLVSHTSCFRKEAGSGGKDTKGIIRQHQFNKVEIVSITSQDKSNDELDRLIKVVEYILNALGLHYRIVMLCSGDLGFSSSITYDVEVWVPSQNKYREISSCSNCLDFQARRLRVKYVDKNSKSKLFAHTLNGSALAIGRTMVAILENYQNIDGTVTVPEVLVTYMNGLSVISRNCK